MYDGKSIRLFGAMVLVALLGCQPKELSEATSASNSAPASSSSAELQAAVAFNAIALPERIFVTERLVNPARSRNKNKADLIAALAKAQNRMAQVPSYLDSINASYSSKAAGEAVLAAFRDIGIESGTTIKVHGNRTLLGLTRQLLAIGGSRAYRSSPFPNMFRSLSIPTAIGLVDGSAVSVLEVDPSLNLWAPERVDVARNSQRDAAIGIGIGIGVGLYLQHHHQENQRRREEADRRRREDEERRQAEEREAEERRAEDRRAQNERLEAERLSTNLRERAAATRQSFDREIGRSSSTWFEQPIQELTVVEKPVRESQPVEQLPAERVP